VIVMEHTMLLPLHPVSAFPTRVQHAPNEKAGVRHMDFCMLPQLDTNLPSHTS
jgi:hypothetical protein